MITIYLIDGGWEFIGEAKFFPYAKALILQDVLKRGEIARPFQLIENTIGKMKIQCGEYTYCLLFREVYE